MATDSGMGLFMTPEMYQQQQRQALYDQAVAESKLDPYQQARVNLQTGVQGLAQIGAGALGAQDPMLQRQSARNQIMSKVNPQDMKSIEEAAIQFSRMGDGEGMRAMQEMAFKQSQIVRNLREKPASATELEKLQDLRAELVSQYGENDPRVKEVNAAISKKTHQGKTLEETMGAGLSAIASAMAGAQAKKAAEAGGTEVGKRIADIGGKQTALDAITGAKGLVDKGIYSGKYGPTMEALSGYSGGIAGSTERLSNTETFRSYLGDVVIPGLKDFGGSDTVEELKYLQSVYAGDTTVQEKTLRNVLNRAENKIRKNISFLQEQQKSIQQGEQLPTGPSAAPKATKRWNPTTGKLEAVQ